MSIWLLRVVIPALNNESVLDNVLHLKKKLYYLTMIVNFVIVNIFTEWIFVYLNSFWKSYRPSV